MTKAQWRGVVVALGLSVGLQLIIWYLPVFYINIGVSDAPFLMLRGISSPGDFEPALVLSWSKVAVIVALLVLYVVGTGAAATRVPHVKASGLRAALFLVSICLFIVVLWPEISDGVIGRSWVTRNPLDSLLMDVHRWVPSDDVGRATMVVFFQLATYLVFGRR